MNRLSVLVQPLFILYTCSITGCTDKGMDVSPWKQIASPPDYFRTHHSFGFSFNGKGYLVAGDTGKPRKDVFEYDPLNNTWTKLSDYPGPARTYGIGDVMDGKAYLGFGMDGAGNLLNDLWVLDPVTMTWTQVASCPCQPRHHPVMIANQGKIYVGLGNGANNFKDFWEYDVAGDSWQQIADLPAEARHHPYQFALGTFVYAGLGHGDSKIFKDWYRFDPATTIWSKMASLPAEGRVAGTQFSFEGKGYILSGDGDDHGPMDTGEFWCYDPVKDAWTNLPPHPGKSRWAPASFVIGDEVYLINGTVLGNFQSDSYKYKLK